MVEQVCTRCNINKDLSSFQEKNGKIFKQCSQCQAEKRSFYQQNKENFDPVNHVKTHSPKEMSIA
ncbi:8515_t:CDS:1, partial [Rhizophagus irregularis]